MCEHVCMTVCVWFFLIVIVSSIREFCVFVWRMIWMWHGSCNRNNSIYRDKNGQLAVNGPTSLWRGGRQRRRRGPPATQPRNPPTNQPRISGCTRDTEEKVNIFSQKRKLLWKLLLRKINLLFFRRSGPRRTPPPPSRGFDNKNVTDLQIDPTTSLRLWAGGHRRRRRSPPATPTPKAGK